jgi:hypothetical protein
MDVLEYEAKGTSEREMRMGRIAAQDNGEFMNDALACHPEGQQV